MDENFVSNPYRKEEKKTLAEIIVNQINSCALEFSKEMKRGFEFEQIVDGQKIIKSSPDTRFSAINHTRTLYDLLQPFFDEQIKEDLKNLMDKMKEELLENFQNYLKSGDKIINIKHASLTKLYPLSPLGDFFEQRSISIKVENYRLMFQLLVLLFKRKNELSGKRTIGYDTK